MNKTKPNKLLDANTAVESYLDNLLQEATEPKTEEAQGKKAYYKEHNIHVLATPLTQTALIKEDDLIDEDTVPDANHVATTERVTNDVLSDDFKGIAPTVLSKENLAFPVQCLMFKVDDHLLAIPLIKMGNVVPFGERLTQLPHSPKYFKGLLKHRGNTVRVVDSASLLLSGAHNGSNAFLPSHLLVFEGEDWAISCDELLDVVTLNEEDIKWHTGKKERLSLGTIKKSLAIILSPDAISKKLTHSDALNQHKQ